MKNSGENRAVRIVWCDFGGPFSSKGLAMFRQEIFLTTFLLKQLLTMPTVSIHVPDAFETVEFVVIAFCSMGKVKSWLLNFEFKKNKSLRTVFET